MKSTDMKAAIQADIETLKTMDVDILPQKEYYGRIRRLYFSVCFKMYASLIFPFLLGYFLDINGMKYPGTEEFETAVLAWVAAVPGTILFSVPLFGLITNYVIFKAQFKDKLKLGEELDRVIKRMARRACWLFWGIMSFSAVSFHPFTLLMLGAFGGGIVMWGTGEFIDMEIKRLGIGVLFDTLKKHFEKNEAMNMVK